MNSIQGHVVIVIGAGPAGLFLAQKLVEGGATVAIFNKDLKPGGLVEYGIFPNKHKLKGGIRKQFQKIFALKGLHYFGGVTVSDDARGDLSLADVFQLGASAVVIATGAQGAKYLGTPGERRPGVYQAKDLVYHYTGLPPFATQDFRIGREVLIVGMGNVSVDISHWLIRHKKVDTVTIMARRGPAERKIVDKELKVIAANLDREDLERELDRVAPALAGIGQDVDAVRTELIAAFEKKPLPAESDSKLRLRFLSTPVELLGEGEDGAVSAARIEHMKLVAEGDGVGCRGSGEFEDQAYDTVIFAIGDVVDRGLGLPYENHLYVTNPVAREDGGHAYEVFDPKAGELLDGVFVAGWSRSPSDGLVGLAKRDGLSCAAQVIEYLHDITATDEDVLTDIELLLKDRGLRHVSLAGVKRLLEEEVQRAKTQGVAEFQYLTNEAMWAVIDGR